MPLTRDHLPLPCSLRERVTRDFAPRDHALSANALDHDKLVAYLARSKDTDGSPLATIRRRAAKDGRGPDLSAEDHASLAWVCEAFADWEENYPIESPVRERIARLLPLAVAVALRDESFFMVGSHPLHQLLDSLQHGAVGWQARLDRAGQMLEQRVERAVEKALDWFNHPEIDIAAVTRELQAANERDEARAQRMVQRLTETEEARIRTISARREAAEHINAGLAEFELPSAIGEFLKGPWYDSAQLVLVKFGEDSSEWSDMRRATRHLMESVQHHDNDEVARDRRDQLLRHLAGELRRWLLSLEHDEDATDSAIGLVEYAHLRLQHGQQLQLSRIPPLPVEGADTEEAETAEEASIGQWYRFEDSEGELRAQLVLQLENGRHLLFANFVGLKALDLSAAAFRQRLEDGFARPLPCDSSFSLSLAGAAGIDSENALRQLVDPSYRPPVEDRNDADGEDGADDAPDRGGDSGDAADAATPQPGTQARPPEPAAAEDHRDEDRPRLDPATESEAETWETPLPGLGGRPAEPAKPVTPPDTELELTLDIEEDTPEPAPPPAPPPATTSATTSATTHACAQHAADTCGTHARGANPCSAGTGRPTAAASAAARSAAGARPRALWAAAPRRGSRRWPGNRRTDGCLARVPRRRDADHGQARRLRSAPRQLHLRQSARYRPARAQPSGTAGAHGPGARRYPRDSQLFPR
jgi:hypothetical protein